MSKNNTKAWAMLTVYLGVLAAMAPLSTDMYLPALPNLQQDFGISTSLAQLTMTMTVAGMAIGQILAGPISDMKGRRLPLMIGMGGFTLSSAGCVIVENIYIFLLLRLIQGLCGACGVVISKAIARDVSRGADLTRFMALLMMVNGFAPILAPVIGGLILSLTHWRAIFLVLLLIGLILTASAFYSQETLPAGRRIKSIKKSMQVFPVMLKDKYFTGHCLIQSFFTAGFFAYIASSSFVFQGVYDVSPQVFSYIFAANGIALAIAGMVPAKFAGKVPDVVLLERGLLTAVTGNFLLLIAFYFSAPLYVIIPILMVGIAPLSVCGSASFSMSMTTQGKNAGSASALLGFCSSILGGLMMPITGMFGTDSGVPMAVFLFGGYAIAIFFFFTMVKPFHKNK